MPRMNDYFIKIKETTNMLVLVFMSTPTVETSNFLCKEILIYTIWMKLKKVVYIKDREKPINLHPK